MTKSTVELLFDGLVQRGSILSSSMSGCTHQEIDALERHFGCTLPATYREFIAIVGRRAGKLFSGTDIFYPRVLQLQSEALILLQEIKKSSVIPANAKVFCMHQGYEISYFLPAADDPPVFQFFEGQSVVTKPWESFSEFIEASVDEHLKQWKTLDNKCS